MITDVTIPAKQCTCDLCGHKWLSFAPSKPVICPGCRSREWDGKKKATHSGEIKFPAPRKPGRQRIITQSILTQTEEEF